MIRRCVFCALTLAIFGTAFFELQGARHQETAPVRITRPVLPAPSPWMARGDLGPHGEKNGKAGVTGQLPL